MKKIAFVGTIIVICVVIIAIVLNDDSEMIEKSQNFLKEHTGDPESVQFKDVKVVVAVDSYDGSYDGGKMVVGRFNAKNGFGQYTGFKRFAVGPRLDNPEVYGGYVENPEDTTLFKAELKRIGLENVLKDDPVWYDLYHELSPQK